MDNEIILPSQNLSTLYHDSILFCNLIVSCCVSCNLQQNQTTLLSSTLQKAYFLKRTLDRATARLMLRLSKIWVPKHFLILYLTAAQPINPGNTVFLQLQPEGRREPYNKVGSLCPAECLVEFKQESFQFSLQCLNTLGHSPQVSQLLSLPTCIKLKFGQYLEKVKGSLKLYDKKVGSVSTEMSFSSILNRTIFKILLVGANHGGALQCHLFKQV